MSYNIEIQKIRTVWRRIAIPTVNNHCLPIQLAEDFNVGFCSNNQYIQTRVIRFQLCSVTQAPGLFQQSP